MTSQEYDERITEHAYTLWRALGVPQAAIGKAIGLTARQVSLRLGGHTRLTPGQLLTLLETVGVDPGDFYRGVRGESHTKLYLARIQLRDERQVKNTKSDRLRRAASKLYTSAELRQVARGLEELRFVDQKAAKTLALDILRVATEKPVALEDLFEARLTLGAIDRDRGNYSGAAFSLLETLRFAGDRGHCKARVLQAVMSLATDLGDFEEARNAIRKARAEFRRLRDHQGEGRSWVSEGAFRLQMGDLDGAVDSYRRSLPIIADGRWIDRYAALHGLALCHVYRNDIGEALRVAARLSTMAKSDAVPPVKRAHALWLRGELRLKEGMLAEGTADMVRVLELLTIEKASALDLALVCLRLAQVYLDAGDLEKLQETGKTLLPLLGRVAHSNKRLQGAMTELLALSIRGELSRVAVDRAYREILTSGRTVPGAAHLAAG